jgi:hypothetical protein
MQTDVLDNSPTLSEPEAAASERTRESLRAEDIARRGQEAYEKAIRAKVEAGNKGKVLVIDVDTGDYEMGDDDMELADRLHAKRENARLYAMRIGFSAFDYTTGQFSAG